MVSPRVYTFLCACFAALGACPLGYDLGVISYTIVATDFLRTVQLEEKSLANDNYTGFIVSSMLLGAFVGSIPASLIADRFSRRTAIVISGIVFILGGVLQTACPNKETMLAGRFFAGIGIGMMGVLCPMYQSEIAHPANRGRLGATYQFFLGIGVFTAGWIAYATNQTRPGTALEWRLPLAFQCLPAVPLVFLTFLLPESPRWLMLRGRHEESLQTLARLHSQGDINDALVLGEYYAMKSAVDEEAELERGWAGIFKDRVNMRKVLYGVIIQFSGQMTGVSAIQYYAPSIFKSVGFDTSALLINSINNVMGLFGEVLCIIFLDRLGRRYTLVFGNLITGTCFAVCTAMAKRFADETGTRGDGITFVAMIYIYNITFSACIGPLSWLYPVEIMNTAIRAKGVALSTMATWIANFMVGQVSPIAFSTIGWQFYILFTVGSFTNAFTFWCLFPETKGRTLEDMDAYFRLNHWFVPFVKADKVDAMSRERELAQAGYHLGGAEKEGMDVEYRAQAQPEA